MNCSNCDAGIASMANVFATSEQMWGLDAVQNYTPAIENNTPARVDLTDPDGLLFETESSDPQSIIRGISCSGCQTDLGWMCTFCYPLTTDMCGKYFIYKSKVNV